MAFCRDPTRKRLANLRETLYSRAIYDHPVSRRPATCRMTDAIIQVENLSKRYVLGQQRDGARYRTLRESIVEAARAPFRRRERKDVESAGDFWALRDVSFEVKRGEVVGIIGRNGAGKSTLLKVLSRITEPTSGRIRIGGRVASLLEVGTGFHPELTGRENIYLNGAILGMHRSEIKAKFDEIVAFAEVEKFLDTPVKRYSSGMYVRLAFAVAAHLEPEILIVDEVLAVGDMEFQKKCLGKMQAVAEREGRTVLFVSHNIGAVTQLCSHAIHLASGSIVDQGNTIQVTSRYLEAGNNRWTEKVWTDLSQAPGDASVRLVSVRAVDAKEQILAEGVDVRETVGVEVQYQVLRDGAIFTPSLHLHNAEGTQIFLAIDLEENWVLSPRACGLYRSVAWIPGNFLNIGMHYASVAISRLDFHTLHLFERQVIGFNINESSASNTSRGVFAGTLPGAIRPILEWKTVLLPS